jgi:hypothetical protein
LNEWGLLSRVPPTSLPGVAFFNLRHADFGVVLKLWKARVEQHVRTAIRKGFTSESFLLDKHGGEDDQSALQHIVMTHPRGRAFVRRYAYGEKNAFNYLGGGFIQHFIRAVRLSNEETVDKLKGYREQFFESCKAVRDR